MKIVRKIVAVGLLGVGLVSDAGAVTADIVEKLQKNPQSLCSDCSGFFCRKDAWRHQVPRNGVQGGIQ